VSGQTERLEEIARGHDTRLDFDAVLARCAAQIICPRIRGLRVIEAGCSTGVVTEHLVAAAREVHVVEGSHVYANAVRALCPALASITCSLFQDYSPPQLADAVVAAGVLHHLENPVTELRRIATWIRPGGTVHITVPSMTSLHRRLGVAMELSDSVYDTSERNRRFAQPGRYDAERLHVDVAAAGLEVIDSCGFFLKPFPHDVMNRIDLPEAVLQGLFHLGREFPELACQLYVEARTPAHLGSDPQP
jgi:2-polyprenyl-3-methyl-5-hydroxy-6-metoxy-1,4-benzoquinol methylase